MREKILETISLLIAFVLLNEAGKLVIKGKGLIEKVANKDLVFSIAISTTACFYIYFNIKSIGNIAIIISILSFLLIFLTSVTIVQDESEKTLEKK